MEQISNLRREKWKVNLKLKRFRTVFNREHITAEEVAALSKPPPYKGRGRPPKRPQVVREMAEADSSEDDEEEMEGEDSVIAEDDEDVSPVASDEDIPLTRDILEGRIKKMKKVTSFNDP